ncbi:hypothetical protein ABPG77_010079 [Micractinium sp. CCAP 211/92]
MSLPAWRVADLIDANSGPFGSDEHQASPLQVLEPGLRNYGGRRVFWGPAATIKCMNSNLLLRSAARERGEGRVLVVDHGASLSSAVLGDILATVMQRQGWAGVIVNGCIRDAEALAGLDIGVKALASNPMKPGKGQPTGLRDVPVVVGGASIRPGDWVYSDDDGIIVSPTELALPTEEELEAMRQIYFQRVLGNAAKEGGTAA